MRKKRVSFPGDVSDIDELGEETSQKYMSLLRKTVMTQRKQMKTLQQQNRRYHKRISTLKGLLKELMEKTKNGNFAIEAWGTFEQYIKTK